MNFSRLKPVSGVYLTLKPKPASLEAISEIISDLCSVVSFIVLDLIFEFTANIRTLELTHVLGTVSQRDSEYGKVY